MKIYLAILVCTLSGCVVQVTEPSADAGVDVGANCRLAPARGDSAAWIVCHPPDAAPWRVTFSPVR